MAQDTLSKWHLVVAFQRHKPHYSKKWLILRNWIHLALAFWQASCQKLQSHKTPNQNNNIKQNIVIILKVAAAANIHSRTNLLQSFSKNSLTCIFQNSPWTKPEPCIVLSNPASQHNTNNITHSKNLTLTPLQEICLNTKEPRHCLATKTTHQDMISCYCKQK